jgi:purine-binding chemotaxis protein CheW
MAKTDNTMDILNLQLTGSEAEEQLIIFSVGNEEYGLNVLRVQEIIRHVAPTKIPHVPDFVEGVINFRGDVIPTICLRKRFGLPARPDNEFSVIIVIEMNGKIIGLTVDQVSDILNIPGDRIQVTPELSARPETQYLKAMGKLGDRLIMILDLDKIMSISSQEQLEQIIAETNPPVTE